MVGFTTRFALLAALSSVAALTVLPTPVRGGLVNADAQDLGPSIAARHSVHGSAAKATADDGGGDDSLDAKHGRKHHKSSGLDGDTPPDSSGTKQQGGHKSLVPLPSPLVSHGNKEPLSSRKEDRKKGERTRKHRPGSKEKHAKEAREVYSIDPMTRMRSLWVGGGMTVRDVQLETLPPHLDKRHHHHHHHHHHPHGSDKVVVKGDDDDVHIHHRFLDLVDPPSSVSDPDDVFVEGTNYDVDVHDHGHDDDDDGDDAVVNGNNDHAHVPRAPMHHHHHPDTVVVKGDDQHVHVHREPSPHHHNHHPDKVVVKGHNDHVHFGRSGVARTRLRSDVQHSPHHRYHPSEVAVKGDHGGVYVYHRALHRRHHHHKTVVEGNHQHVHLGRSPAASPEHHHHHHRPNKVVVKGHHDHVDVHRKRFQDLRHPIVIGANRGKAYLIPHEGPISVSASAQAHARRDVPFSGVPGTIEIISQDSESKATRIASLVVATPNNGSTVAGSPFVLNASDTDRTQMYMVPASSATNGTSASSSSNSTSSPPSGPPAAPSAGLPAVPPPGSTPPSTGSPAPAPPAGSARRSTDSFVKVLLQTPIFDAASAQLKPYCATFDPRPSSPAPMTVEECMDPISSDIHKSQVFAYEPNTSLLHPMWYAGEDDGTSGDDPAPSAPSAPDSTPSAPSNPPASPSGAPAAPSPPAEPASSPPSPPVNSSTPVSNGVPAVTSFEQEALEGEFGDSTHSPVRVPEVFAVEALQNATNVMLMFAPITPEVLPNSPVGKVAELPVLSVSVDPSATSSPADVSTATGSDSTQSVSTSSTVDSTTTTSTSTADASATDSGSSTVVTEQASATPSDASSGDSSSATAPKDLLAAVTPSPALEVVKVYDVGANDTADGPSGSTTISASGSTATTTTTLSSNSTESDSSMKPTMTPVSTAPYEWMFKGTNASP